MKILLLFLLIPFTAAAQQCTTATPCYQVTITNGNPLPQTTVLWRCSGGSSGCSSSALNDAITQQVAGGCGAVNSTWSCVTFSQANPLVRYNDPVQYGLLVNYAASGGGATGPTQIITFHVPPAAKALTISGSSQIVTAGNSGLQ